MNRRVAFQDFKAPYQELKPELDAVYQRFMESGWYVLGKEVQAFEEEYAGFCGASHCVGVGHGLDALHLGLRAMEIGPGDEVIVPSNTYIATWLAVSQCGATPVGVEPDPRTYNMDPDRIEMAITERTKVILAVNLYGQPCDYDSIRAIADKHGLRTMNDNAQAQGARYRGQPVGGIFDVECHSFYPTKNLGAFGEAGAVTTQQAEIADKLRVLRNYGSRVRYHNEVVGYNSRLDELQAGFLRVKLNCLPDWNQRRAKLAGIYLEELADVPGLQIPFVPDWAEPVWHLFVVQCEGRDSVRKSLEEAGVQTLIHYPIPSHLSGAYADLKIPKGSFPIAEKMADSLISLPIGPHHEPDDILYVAHNLKQALASR